LGFWAKEYHADCMWVGNLLDHKENLPKQRRAI